MMSDPAFLLAMRLCLATLFGVSATHKILHLGGFVRTVGDYGLLPANCVDAAAFGLVSAEAALGVSLLSPLYAMGAIGAALLFCLYGFAIGVNLIRGRKDFSCGCSFAGQSAMVHPWMVLRNLALAAIALGLGVMSPATRSLTGMDMMIVAAALSAFCLLYLCLEIILALPRSVRP
jgi:Methylamine utilisation protein MauE